MCGVITTKLSWVKQTKKANTASEVISELLIIVQFAILL